CPGLEVSLSQLLERCLLQLRFGEQPLERRVLLLELLQALRVVGLEPAVLVPPSVVRLLGHSELPAHRRDIPPVGEHPVGLAELADDLFRGVTLPAVRHDLTSLPAHNRGRQDDSQNHRTYETGSAHFGRAASHCLNICFDRPAIMFSNLAGPVLSRAGVRSIITVTYLSPNLVWPEGLLKVRLTPGPLSSGKDGNHAEEVHGRVQEDRGRARRVGTPAEAGVR